MNANLLDILFEGKNKEYGAYELRKNYNHRITIAIISMSAMCVLFFLTQIFGNNNDKVKSNIPVIEITLKSVKEPEEKMPELPKVQPKETASKVEITRFVTPVTTKDNEVKEPSPTVEIRPFNTIWIMLDIQRKMYLTILQQELIRHM